MYRVPFPCLTLHIITGTDFVFDALVLIFTHPWSAGAEATPDAALITAREKEDGGEERIKEGGRGRRGEENKGVG